MKTVILYTQNAVFKFPQKEVMEFLICNGSQYDPDGVARLTDLISNASETILNLHAHHFFYLYLPGVFYGIRFRIRRPPVRIRPGIPLETRGEPLLAAPFLFQNQQLCSKLCPPAIPYTLNELFVFLHFHQTFNCSIAK